MEDRAARARGSRIPIGIACVNVAFAALVVAIALSAFHDPTPHGIPVGIVAPAPAVRTIDGVLDAHLPGGVVLHRYANAPEARSAVDDRRVDGAVLVSPHTMVLMTAEAGGTAVAETLTGVFEAAAVHSGRVLTVIDVVPPATGDSEALSPFFIILGVLFPSLATGAAMAHVLRGRRPAWRVGAPVAVAATIGLVVAGVADGITGLGHYGALAATVGLFSLAISAPTAALGGVKLPLVGVSVVLFLVLGLPVSGGPAGLASFGPGSLRWLDSVLPLGVAAAAVRNTVYFGSNDVTGHLWVLGAWASAGVGVLAVAAGHPRRRGSSAAETASVTV